MVDVAMTEGSAYLSTFLSLSQKTGIWQGMHGEGEGMGSFVASVIANVCSVIGPRGCSMLDGGAPFYET